MEPLTQDQSRGTFYLSRDRQQLLALCQRDLAVIQRTSELQLWGPLLYARKDNFHVNIIKLKIERQG